MKKVVIIKNPRLSSHRETDEVVSFLVSSGVEYVVLSTTDYGSLTDIEKEFLLSADMAICIGGDGTILSAGRLLLERSIPIFGINTGHLGYLTTAEPQEAIEALRKVANGSFTVEERVTLSINYRNKEYFCINEGVFHRGEQPHLLKVGVDVNGHEVDSIRGDGILIATPTGSTAYNLSAGGPVVAPTAKGMVVTPVCAHSLSARPVVLAENDIVTISVYPDGSEAGLAVDGKNVGKVAHGEKVKINISDKKLLLIRTEERSFYQTLQKKLSENNF